MMMAEKMYQSGQLKACGANAIRMIDEVFSWPVLAQKLIDEAYSYRRR